MMHGNKFCFFGVYMLLCTGAMAQTVKVKDQRESVRGDNVEGYGAELEGKKADIQSSWIKFLKDIGKVKQGDPVTISEPVFNGLVFSKGVIYSITREQGEMTSVWLGIKPGEWDASDVTRINNELEKGVYRFGIRYYKDKIQVQIDDAQEAWDAVEKQKQRMVNQNKDLTMKLSNNGLEKIQLEKSLEANKFENAVLILKLKNNMKAQDSLTQAALQIEKIKQMHQDRQRKVN
jgi:hypothetical protein